MKELERLWTRAAAVPGLRKHIVRVVSHMVRQAERAQAAYSRFHWGRSARKARASSAPLVCPGDVLTELGRLSELAYVTRKGRGETYEWHHSFSRPLPVLTCTDEGALVIVGGRYKITERGIVG